MQQFLYTFRYFCTPQDFLHFLLDRMDSTLARCARPAGPGAHCGRDGPGRGHRCPWGWGRDCPKGRSAPRHQARRVPQSRRPSASNPQPPRTGRGGGRCAARSGLESELARRPPPHTPVTLPPPEARGSLGPPRRRPPCGEGAHGTPRPDSPQARPGSHPADCERPPAPASCAVGAAGAPERAPGQVQEGHRPRLGRQALGPHHEAGASTPVPRRAGRPGHGPQAAQAPLFPQSPAGPRLYLLQDLQAQLLPAAGLGGGLPGRGPRPERRPGGQARGLHLLQGDRGWAAAGPQQHCPIRDRR